MLLFSSISMPRGVGVNSAGRVFHPAQLNCPMKVPSCVKSQTFLQHTSEMRHLPLVGSMARCVGYVMLPPLQPMACW